MLISELCTVIIDPTEEKKNNLFLGLMLKICACSLKNGSFFGGEKEWYESYCHSGETERDYLQG